MNDLTIPCMHLWSPATITDPHDTVKISVGKGNSIREYDIRADVLKQRSGYFRMRLHDDPEKNNKRPPLRFPDESPAVFDKFAAWLYQGTLRREDTVSSLFICQLFAFATTFDVPLLRNTIIDAFLAKMYRQNTIPYDIASYLDEHLRDSSLRNLFIDIVLKCGEKKMVEEWKVSLSKGFFGKSAFAQGDLVPFGMSSNLREHIWQLKEHVCHIYHEHLSGDEMVLVEGDPFFFDPPLQ